MASTIEHFRNKFRRLVIEVHHRKNKVGHKEHVIKYRDPNKPLITLRAAAAEGYFSDEGNEDGSELSELDNQFNGFEGTFTEDVGKSDEILTSIPPGVSRVSSFERRESLHSSRTLSPILTTSDIDRARIQLQMEEDTKRLEKALQNNINYIQQKDLPPRKRFWLFGKRYSNFKYLKTEKSPESVELINEDETEASSLNNIELIAHYTKAPNNDDKDDGILGESTEIALEPFNFQVAGQYSSYARKKHNVSLLSLSNPPSRDNCHCNACYKKLNLSAEPWKIVMNDISLHAALLSTGSKPQLPYDSYKNLVADFTSSKHQDSETNKEFFSKLQSELTSLKTDDPINIGQLAITNDENRVIDSDLLDLSKSSTRRYTSRSSVRQKWENSQSLSKSSVISGLPGTEVMEGQPSSEIYDNVFQNYAYLDEDVNDPSTEHQETQDHPTQKVTQDNEGTTSDIRPLKLSIRGLNRLF